MSIHLLILLLVVTFVAILAGRRRTSLIAAGLSLALAAGVGSGLPAALLLDRLQTVARLDAPEWRSRNVIVLLGWEIVRWPAGEVTTGVRGAARVVETARQYFDCRSRARVCRVLVSGGDPLDHGRPEAEAMAESLRQLGVAAEDLILESRSRNTFKNAEFSAALMRNQDFDRIVLVTSGFHLSRARLYFEHFVQTPILGAPADRLETVFSWLPVTQNFAHLDLALTEIAGLLRFRIYNSLGWNPPGVR